ncbi:hypothetical protein GCM10027058_30640 [Microbacterium neimengense]
MTDADDSTRLSRRGPDQSEQPEDSTQLVSRRDRRNASASAATDATAIVSRETPAAPADETVIVDRAPAAPTVAPEDVDDRTALVRRPVEAPSPEKAPPPDEAEDGTLLVRRAAPTTDATVVVPRTTPVSAVDDDDEDEHTILTPRSPSAIDALDTDDTVLRPRDEPQDATLLRRRDRPANADADADADADDTVLRPRDAVADDATSLSPRGTKAGASPRLTRARRGGAAQTASFAPDAQTDRTPARERYAIRTPTITAAPASTASASQVVDIGDGGLAARIARRRATRTRLTVLASVSAVVFLGSIVGLATLLSI